MVSASYKRRVSTLCRELRLSAFVAPNCNNRLAPRYGDIIFAGVMGRQPDLHPMYDDPQAAFSQEGRAAGNEVLSTMFGSPDASRAIADQAQQFSAYTKATESADRREGLILSSRLPG